MNQRTEANGELGATVLTMAEEIKRLTIRNKVLLEMLKELLSDEYGDILNVEELYTIIDKVTGIVPRNQ